MQNIFYQILGIHALETNGQILLVLMRGIRGGIVKQVTGVVNVDSRSLEWDETRLVTNIDFI